MKVFTSEARRIADQFPGLSEDEKRHLMGEVDRLMFDKVQAAADIMRADERLGSGRHGWALEIMKLMPVRPEGR
ncbi:hypothetical protein [Leisingera daeponensis]|uniref:hypothetical protein n=1 Tax=Leisingera daeponensis TaxID=405746 RepID=UPI001C94B285|nr:hypothetical protein [Leisingera daeponensis]MBY6055359.1 hypothetical protein [Leisingera daeponensis]